MQVTAPHLSAVYSVGRLANRRAPRGSLNCTSATFDICWHVAPPPQSAPCPGTSHSVPAELKRLGPATSPLPFTHLVRKAAGATGP